MFFFGRYKRRRRGVGLTGILLAGVALYGSGAGGWLTDHIAKLPQSCYQGAPSQYRLCQGVQGVVDMVVQASTATGNALDSVAERFMSFTGKTSDFAQSRGFSDTSFASFNQPSSFGFSLSGLAEKLGLDGDVTTLLDGNISAQSAIGSSSFEGGDLFKAALSRYAAAEELLNPRSRHYAPASGLNWHEQGAATGAYGINSQLALAGFYSQGQGAQDAGHAQRYYAQALESLSSLMGSDDAQAKALLSGFATPPEDLRRTIIQQMQAISTLGRGK